MTYTEIKKLLEEIRKSEQDVLVLYDKNELSDIQEYELRQAISNYHNFLKEIIEELE